MRITKSSVKILLISATMLATVNLKMLCAQELSADVRQGVQTFKANGDIDVLLRLLAKAAPAKDQKGALSLKLAVLAELMPAYDPTYDTNPPPLPSSQATPPSGYDSGVAPSAVTDPTERAAYEKRIAANERLAQYHKTQRAIRQILSSTNNLLLTAGSSVRPDDKQELAAKVNALLVPDQVKQALQRNLDK